MRKIAISLILAVGILMGVFGVFTIAQGQIETNDDGEKIVTREVQGDGHSRTTVGKSNVNGRFRQNVDCSDIRRRSKLAVAGRHPNRRVGQSAFILSWSENDSRHPITHRGIRACNLRPA